MTYTPVSPYSDLCMMRFSRGPSVEGSMRIYGSNTNAGDILIANYGNSGCYFLGNVGISNLSPNYPLDVTGSANATALYENNTAISTKYAGIAAANTFSGTSNTFSNIVNANGGVSSTNGSFVTTNGSVQALSFNATSDYRIKENVIPLRETTLTVDHLNPIVYTNKRTLKKDIGVLAHELQEHFPFLVQGEKDDPDEMQSVNYIGIIGLLIKEVQGLKASVEQLEKITS